MHILKLTIFLYFSFLYISACRTRHSVSDSASIPVINPTVNNEPNVNTQALYLITDPDASKKIQIEKVLSDTEKNLFLNPSNNDVILAVAFDEGHPLYNPDTGITYLVAKSNAANGKGLQLVKTSVVKNLEKVAQEDVHIRSFDEINPPHVSVAPKPPIRTTKSVLIRPSVEVPPSAPHEVKDAKMSDSSISSGNGQILSESGSIHIDGSVELQSTPKAKGPANGRLEQFFQNMLFGSKNIRTMEFPGRNLMRKSTISTGGDNPLKGVWYEPPFKPLSGPESKPENRTVVLFFSGSGYRTEAWAEDIASFYASRYDADLISFNYHGYGDSLGTPSEAGIYADGLESLKYVRDLGYKDENIILHGFSMGAVPASQVALSMKTWKHFFLDRPLKETVAGIEGNIPIIPKALAKVISKKTGVMDAPVRLAEQEHLPNPVSILANDDFSYAGAKDLAKINPDIQLVNGTKVEHLDMSSKFYEERFAGIMGSEGNPQFGGSFEAIRDILDVKSKYDNRTTQSLTSQIYALAIDPEHAHEIETLISYLRILNKEDALRVLGNKKFFDDINPYGAISKANLMKFSRNLPALDNPNISSKEAANILLPN